MKATFTHTLGMAFVALTILASTTSAALIVNDPFLTGGSNYVASNLSGQGPAVPGMTGNWLAGSAGSFPVNSTGLDYSDPSYAAESGGRVDKSTNARLGRLLSTPYTNASSGTVYLSFLMQTPNTFTGDYRSLELHNGGFDDGTHRKFQLGFHSGDFNSTTNYGFRVNNSNSFRALLGANDGAVKLFVVKFDLSTTTNADTVTVWQNPTLGGGGDPVGGTSLTGFDLAFDRISLAQFAGPTSSWDEIRLGDTFADVTVAVPEPSSLTLMGLSCLGLIGFIRRFKR